MAATGGGVDGAGPSDGGAGMRAAAEKPDPKRHKRSNSQE